MAKRSVPALSPESSPVANNAQTPGPAVRVTGLCDFAFAAGQVHPREPRDYPAGWFSARQVDEMGSMASLAAEVIEEPDPPTADAGPVPEVIAESGPVPADSTSSDPGDGD